MMFNEKTFIVALEEVAMHATELENRAKNGDGLIDVLRVRALAEVISLDTQILVELMGGKWPYD